VGLGLKGVRLFCGHVRGVRVCPWASSRDSSAARS
jgi:hypothetical protein